MGLDIYFVYLGLGFTIEICSVLFLKRIFCHKLHEEFTNTGVKCISVLIFLVTSLDRPACRLYVFNYAS